MSSGPLATPGARPTLFLALAMSSLGVFGVIRSTSALGTDANDVAAGMDASSFQSICGGGESADLTLAGEALERAAVDAAALQFTLPERRGEHAANFVVSALLILASFFLTTRRPTALWWTSQALLANVAFTAGSIGVELWLRLTRGDAFRRLASTWEDALTYAGCLPPSPESTVAAQVLVWTVVTVGVSVCLGLVYLLLWRLSRMQTIQRFIAG